MVASALIGAGASLLGGLFKKKPKEKSAEQNSREAILGQAAGARQASEKYGFNPLTLLGASSAVGPSYTTSENYMGNAIADAGMILADHISGKKEAGQITQLKEQNEKLRKQIQDQTLRPKVGGIYARREAVATTAQALGRKNGRSETAYEKPNKDHPLVHGLGDVADPDPTIDRGAGFFAGGGWFQPAPGWSPGQRFEDEYGDTPLSWPYAAAKLAADTGYNLRRGVHALGIPTFADAQNRSLADQYRQGVGRFDKSKKRPKPKTKSNKHFMRQRGTGPSPHNPVYPR